MSAIPTDPRAALDPALTRRRFLEGGARLALAAAAVGLPSLSLGCWKNPTSPGPVAPRQGDGRLQTRPPAAPPGTSLAPGLHQLDFIPERRAVLYVPEGHAADTPAPLVVSFHGAGGTAAGWMSAGWPELADAAGVLILAPESLASTWDAIHGPFGQDLAYVDAALAWTLERCAVDPARLTAHGFSDGGSYALSAGLANGDLFHRVVAHSPGFIVEATPHGKPPVLITHGTLDGVLPIDQTSRRIVPYLRDHGYTVDFREFAGGHQVPSTLAAAGLAWAAEA